VAGLTGDFLILAFFGLASTAQGFRITFEAAHSASSPGEVYFWLGHALFLFPACCLLGYSLAPRLGPALVHRWAALNSLSRRKTLLGLVAIFLLAVAVARVGRIAVLYDLPFTDDEYAVEFGGHIMATGHVTTPRSLPEAAIPTLGLFLKDGRISRADWPGAQAVWAIAELTRLGPFVWAILAAVPILALGILMARRLGAGWGFIAGIVFLCSPMALMLSLTTHAHLASRAMLALAVAGYWFAGQRGTLWGWVLTGLALGLGFLCRPLEIAFFSAPLLVWAVAQSVRGAPGYTRALPGLVIGGIVPVLLMLAHAYAVTGHPLVLPRMTESHDVQAVTLWVRFGANMAYNTFMLAIWFLGPLGIILVGAGVMTDHYTRLLGLGVLADLLLALFHTNMGLHSVGPIHYSECAVPLTIIAVHGLANLLRGAREHRFDLKPIASAFTLALVLGLGIFNVIHALALQEQARIQRDIYAWIDHSVYEPAGKKVVVLAPQFAAIWIHMPWMRQLGTQVFEWRRPRLDLSDDVLIVHDRTGVEAWLRERMSERRLYRIELRPEAPYALLRPLDTGSPIPWCGPSPGIRACGRL
jgi:hypothetical protein